MRAVEGSLATPLKGGIGNWKALAQDKARLGAPGLGGWEGAFWSILRIFFCCVEAEEKAGRER